MKVKLILLFVISLFSTYSCFSQGCLIAKYDTFDKVFNKPTAAGATTFVPGNGNNFVNFTGACGIHTYIQVFGASTGSCSVTENGTTKNGLYYTNISPPFKSPCNVPLDDHIWWVMLIIVPVTYFSIRKKNSLV